MNNSFCLGACTPPQIITFNYPYDLETINSICVCNECGEKYTNLQYSYSVDSSCWSCFMTLNELNNNLVGIKQDYYIKIKVFGTISSVSLNGSVTTDYSTQLASGFNFSSCSTTTNSNTFNPYANMETAISLQQQLTETVTCMFGIPCYYFKLSPNAGSKDITFKEYTLMDVESVKQIKIMIQDGVMPSSKPEFAEFGLDWQTDWETEISKSTFATAFGNTAQPMEGDLIYIPMMKRMWMVDGSYEEKNDNLMWNATTFKVTLVKYQEKGSVNLGDTESMVNTFVKNKYEDLFGEEEGLSSGEASVDAPLYAPNNVKAVYTSDATRKYVTCDSVSVLAKNKVYYKGTVISDNQYYFTNISTVKPKITYQKKYCGDAGTISFIFTPSIATYNGNIVNIGKYFSISLKQNGMKTTLYVNKLPAKLTVDLDANATYFVILKWSKELNTIDFSVYPYTWTKDVPLYKLNSSHYYFNIDNPIIQKTTKYNSEFTFTEKSEISAEGFSGWLTNIKVFDIYDDDIAEVLQTYPNNQHLLVNDTARKLLDNNAADSGFTIIGGEII